MTAFLLGVVVGAVLVLAWAWLWAAHEADRQLDLLRRTWRIGTWDEASVTRDVRAGTVADPSRRRPHDRD